MKKLNVLMMVAILVATLTACSNKSQVPPVTIADVRTVQTTAGPLECRNFVSVVAQATALSVTKPFLPVVVWFYVSKNRQLMYRLKSSEDISPRGEIAASWDLEFPLDSVEVLNFCMVSFYGLPPAKIDVPKGVNKVLHIGADTYLVFDNEQAPKRVADSVKHWRNSLAVKN